MRLWEMTVLGNSVQAWAAAGAVAAVVAAALLMLRRAGSRRWALPALAEGLTLGGLIGLLLRRIHPLAIAAAAAYAGTLALALPPGTRGTLRALAGLALLAQVGLWGGGLIAWVSRRYIEGHVVENPAAATAGAAFGFLARLALWSVILLVALANLGVDVTALVAGLGIGGIALGLALQRILGDIFASFSIVLDRPFIVGDFIVVGDYLGVVEHIGLKTTRLRSLSGEQLIFANGDLLESRIRNYKRMYERRVTFTLGVTYDTTYDDLKALPGIIREVVESQEGARFDRAHFKAYGDFSLVFEIVYYVTNPDYNVYMDIQQAINLEIYRRFSERGIEFAFPTQTVFVKAIPETQPSGTPAAAR